nr:MAG TPA: hypothetical protein [Caudoviricetes sp.]
MTENRRAQWCIRIPSEWRQAPVLRPRPCAVMFSRSYRSPLSIKFFVKSQFPDSPAEKVVDVVVTTPVLCPKVLVDHGIVPVRGNVFDTLAIRKDIGHILAYAHDLACSDRRMRFAHVLLVLLEVVPEHAQGILQAIDTLRVYTRGYICKSLKIKRQ